ncbi:MAG TPA: TetR/AcrR family transcriptional regulator [Streptosporangiaceae bacterium]|nr:TetR/AcrR family transcriptional regulator [Streptosporangiaceae bacterium]
MALTPSARTRQIGDAAIAVLAEHGARGLTHRAVDQAAGLPPGTTSNYARTRAALLTLVLTRIDELDTAEATGGADVVDVANGAGDVRGASGVSGTGPDGTGPDGAGPDGAGSGGAGMADALADALAALLDRWITDPGARRRVLARFELALEATRRPELRAAYDEMGQAIRVQVVRLLAAAGSARPERDAWTLIASVEGTAFYALAGAGGAAVPSRDELRAQVTGLLASLRGDGRGAA